MPVSATTLELLMRGGLAGEALIEVVRAIDADMAPVKTVDAQAERRRAADRERAKVRRQSADSPQTQAEQKKVPPDPPIENNPSSSLRSEEAEPDARTRLFRDGLSTLVEITGSTPTRMRSLVGKWLRDTQDDALRVYGVILKAAQDRPAEPIPWIERHFRAGAGPPQLGKPRRASAIAAEQIRAMQQKSDEPAHENILELTADRRAARSGWP